MSEKGDISGDWNGVYAYHQRYQDRISPVRFQASFAIPDAAGRFEGRVTDENGLGAASVLGSIEGQAIRFIKTYQWTRFQKARPIHYVGTLSEDGLFLTGTWQIHGRLLGFIPFLTEGNWQALRPGLSEPPLVWPPPPQVV